MSPCMYNFWTYMSSSGGTVNDAQVVHLMRRKVQDENEAANHRKNLSTSRKAHPLIWCAPARHLLDGGQSRIMIFHARTRSAKVTAVIVMHDDADELWWIFAPGRQVAGGLANGLPNLWTMLERNQKAQKIDESTVDWLVLLLIRNTGLPNLTDNVGTQVEGARDREHWRSDQDSF